MTFGEKRGEQIAYFQHRRDLRCDSFMIFQHADQVKA
jgi:hypothetical protein